MSNEESKDNKYNQLIGVLAEKFGLTGKEIADIFWLTLKRQEHSNINFSISNVNTQTNDTPPPEVVEQPKPPQPKQNPASEKISTTSKSPSPSPNPAPKADIIPEATDSTSSKTLPIRVTDAPSLRESLQLTRSLKALMLRIDSGRRVVLDEIKSAERTAAEGFFAVVLKSELELLFELALVVDESKSMLIWRHTIYELKALLEGSGFFRDVRTWGLVTDPNEKQKIYFRPGIGKTANKQRFASHRELIDPQGRRLILVVSDCVSAIWRNGAVTQVLKDWTNSQPVAIIQMLPDWLWLRTGLVTGASVILGSLAPGVANKELLIKELLLWKDIELDAGVKVPVLTLQPEVAVSWSRMVAGKSDANASGFVFSRELPKKSSNDKSQSESENKLENQTQNITQNTKSQIEDSQDRVYRFRMTASPMARKLAGLLAAAPVITLPVVRLIRETLLKESKQVHVAEVFLGGLLKPLAEIEADTNPDTMHYDFMYPEIRNILLAAAPVKDSADVLDAVSEHIAKQLGKSIKEFVAYLKAPEKIGDKHENEQVKAFAKLALQILRQLGGGYRTFAEELEQDAQLNAEFSQFPPLKSFDFEIPTVSLEEDTETSADFNLQPFTFEVALLEVNESARLNTDNPLEVADEIIFTQTGKHLNDIEKLVVQGALANQTYQQIAASGSSSEKDLRSIGLHLWKVFSEVVGERVNKQNLPNILKQWAESRHLTIHRHQEQNQYFVQDLGNGVELEMVQIRGGTFTMGAPKDEEGSSDRERPQHEVKVPTFFMGKYPVTQAQWKFVASLEQVKRELKPDPSHFKGDNRPVEQVTWSDSVEFCDRLSQYTNKNYRLPSEAEWEYACRAGTSTPFHFGERIISKLANYDAQRTYGAGAKGIYRGETTEVGTLGGANAFGLYDMHGNVWEWCADQWHKNYEGAPTDGSAWIDDNDNDNHSRLLRGGSWYDYPEYCRCASRSSTDPGVDDSYSGLRVVCGVLPRALK